MPLASHIRKYFWDIDPETAAPKKYPEYYITRILEYGDEKAFRWLMLVYGKKKIKLIAGKGKLSPKSRNYWRLVL
jgi:hypothetical protein